MQEASAIIFDFGGVLSATTDPVYVKEYVAVHGWDWAPFAAAFRQYRALMDGGFITLSEYYRLVNADNDFGWCDATIAELVAADLKSYLARNEATIAWVKELKLAGRKLGLLTNMPVEMAAHMRREFADVLDCFDAVVVSGEEKVFKPQAAIYRIMSARIGVKPADLIFFDDNEVNCAGARTLGWNAIRFESVTQAQSTL